MYYRILNRSDIAVVTLKQAKNQLNMIDGEDDGVDDEHIQFLTDTAVELAEKYTGRLFTIETVELLVKNCRSFFLPCGEVESVTSAVVTCDSSSAGFSFSPISQKFTFDDSFDITKEVVVTYNAGYAKPENAAIMGSMMLLSSLWENREDTVTGVTVADIPLDSTAILDSIRLGYF
jgi:hypothetical protein